MKHTFLGTVIIMLMLSCSTANEDKTDQVNADTMEQKSKEEIKAKTFDEFLAYFPEQKLPIELRGEWKQPEIDKYTNQRLDSNEAR